MNDESNALPDRLCTSAHHISMAPHRLTGIADLMCKAAEKIESLTREKATYKDKFEIAIAVLEGKSKPMPPIGDSHDPEIARKLEERYQAALAIHAKQQEAIANYDTLRAELDAAKGRQTGWLIENGKSGSQLLYRTMEQGNFTWTPDHNIALRFARREDAERVAEEDEDAWRIVERAWVDMPKDKARHDTARSRGETGEKIG